MDRGKRRRRKGKAREKDWDQHLPTALGQQRSVVCVRFTMSLLAGSIGTAGRTSAWLDTDGLLLRHRMGWRY
jgi:hypothetical protein